MTGEGTTTIPTDARREVEHATLRALAEADDIEEAASDILGGICEALGWDLGAMWILDGSGDSLRCVEVWRRDDDGLGAFADLIGGTAVASGEGLPGRVWTTGGPVWISDAGEAARLPDARAAKEHGLDGALGFPISVRGELQGALAFFGSRVHEPDAALLEMLGSVAHQIASFIEWEQMQAELHFQRALLEYQGESAPYGIGVISPEMRVLYWNQRILEMFDISEDALADGDASALIGQLIRRTSDPDAVAELADVVFSDPEASRRVEVEMADGRIVDVWTAPVSSPDGRIYGRAVYCSDITDQKRAEELVRRDEEWKAFLADAMDLLARSLDLQTGLDNLARLAVPRLADWCVIHIVDATGVPQPLAVAHVDPSKVGLARRIQERYPADPEADPSVWSTIRTREPVLLPDIPLDMLEAAAQDQEHLRILRALDLRSAIIVPIVARDRALGAITFAGSESGRRFDASDLERAGDLASRAAFPIDNARLFDETRVVAQTLQKSFLPPQLPDVPGVDISARYFAAGEGAQIGGDFYDAFRIDQRRWGFVLGDVSGKGLEAATVTTLARHTIRGAALTARHPSEVLDVLNTALLEQHQTDRFCTAVYAILEPRFARVRVTVASGGHPPPYVIRNDGTVEPIPCSGTLLGFMDGVALRDATVELEFGDKLFLYTDGVLDIRQKAGMFGPDGLERLLYNCSKRGTESAAEHIATTVAELQGGRATDDVAFILLGVRSSVFNIRRRRSSNPEGDAP